MIEVEEAISRIVEGVWSGGGQRVSVAESIGCYAGEKLLANRSIPGGDQSAVDGFALNHDSPVSGTKFNVVGSIPAGGKPSTRLASGESMRVFTGAPVPRGATAVVMQEDVRISVEGTRITLRSDIQRGEWIRRKGSAICAGQTIIEGGKPLTPAVIGLVASQGLRQIEVGARPRVSVISTGDELVPSNETCSGSRAYDSNGPMLETFCRQVGVRQIKRSVSCDNLAETVARIESASDGSDLILLTGGVSVGEFDYVKPALVKAGYSIDFWRVNMKPGKPFLFARRERDRKVVLALPGNPVSAFVTFALFVIPAIRRWMGAAPEECLLTSALTLTMAELLNPSDRPQYIRGVITGDGFRPFGLRESHALRSVAGASALLRLEPRARVERGEEISIILLPMN